MPTLFGQLRTRLILGALLFLLVLTGAVVLVVRDSLLFSARSMEEMRAEELLAQGGSALLEVTKREAELMDQVIRQNPSGAAALYRRLQDLSFTPNTYAFIVDQEGDLVAVTEGRAAWPGSQNQDLYTIISSMLSGQSKSVRLILNGEEVLAAFAPLIQTGGALAVITPVSDLTVPNGQSPTNIENSVNEILRATLVTIGYFAVLVIVGIVLATRALTGPIQSLVEGTRSIATGDLTARIPARSSDELGVLAKSFNQMAEQLQARNDELTRAYETLSEREARLRLITEVTTDALYEWNITTGKTQ